MLVIRKVNGRYVVVENINGRRMSDSRYFRFLAEKDLRKLLSRKK